MALLIPTPTPIEYFHASSLYQNSVLRNYTWPCTFKGRVEAAYIAYAGVTFCCITICQSVMSIATVYLTPALHTNQYIFLVSLALVDIGLSLSFGGNLCFHISEMQHRQINHILADTILFGITFSSITLGAVHMGIIAIERYLRIAYPFYYIRCITKQRILKILVSAWMSAMVNAVIPVIFYRHDKYHVQCINTHHPLAYFVPNSGIILITVVIVVICYSKIAHLSVKHNKAATARRLQSGHENGDTKYRTYGTTLLKSVKFCAITCGIYFACGAPPFFTIILGFSYNIPDLLASAVLHTFSLHSMLNFFVTCRMNRSFFQALKKLLSKFRYIFLPSRK